MALRYTEVNFDTKLLLVPYSGVRNREVFAIFVSYKEVFLLDFDHDFIGSLSVCYREVSATNHVRYKEVPL